MSLWIFYFYEVCLAVHLPSRSGKGCRIQRLHICRGVRLPQQASCSPVGWGCRIHRLQIGRGVRLPQQASCSPVGWGCRIHRLHLCRGVRLPKRVSCGPGDRGCRIHRLHICSRVRLPQRVSSIWNKTIWWRGSSNAGALGNAEYPFIDITPRSTLARNGCTW